MSLTKEDIDLVRGVVVEAIQSVVMPHFEILETDIADLKTDVHNLQQDMRDVKGSLKSLDGRVEALESDVKELYAMVAASAKNSNTDKKFARLSVEQKVLKMYEDVKLLAHETGVTLPN